MKQIVVTARVNGEEQTCLADPRDTLLEILRDRLGLTGTKEGCAEGDCGACTVVLLELNRDGDDLSLKAINSCIQFLPTIDGKELVTVESLSPAGGELHPVQRESHDPVVLASWYDAPGATFHVPARTAAVSAASPPISGRLAPASSVAAARCASARETAFAPTRAVCSAGIRR